MEANPAWPPPFRWRLRFSPDWYYGKGGTFFYGCALQSLHDLLQPRGYFLLQYVMEDAWYVRNDTLSQSVKNKIALYPRDAYMSGNPHAYYRCSSLDKAYISHKILSIEEQSEFSGFVEKIEQQQIVCGKYSADHAYFYKESLRRSFSPVSSFTIALLFFLDLVCFPTT